MAKKKKEAIEEPVKPTMFRSAVCGLGNAVTQANVFADEGYDIKYCFAVVANDPADGKPVQAVYMLAKKKDA